MIIEFFGLSNTGKSVLKRELEKKGYRISKPEKIPETMKFFLLVIRHSSFVIEFLSMLR